MSTATKTTTKRHLGKLAPRHDPLRPKIHDYLDRKSLPAAPSKVDYTKGRKYWGMMLNGPAEGAGDSPNLVPQGCGDCTCATVGHIIMVDTLNASGVANRIPDQAVLSLYEAVTGEEGAAFDPASGANDNGCNIADVLSYWQKYGVYGHKLFGWADGTPTDLATVESATWLLGPSYFGVQVPQSAMDQNSAGQPWTVSGNGAIVGGHAIPLVGFDPEYFYFLTWGGIQPATRQWVQTYADEVHFPLLPEWVSKSTKKAPSGFNWQQLAADLAAIGPVQHGKAVGDRKSLGPIWLMIEGLLASIGKVLTPAQWKAVEAVVVFDIATGKQFGQIVADVLAAITTSAPSAKLAA